MYATALSLAMDSTGDASVIYVPCTKAAPYALFGGCDNSVPIRGSAPKFSFGQTLTKVFVGVREVTWISRPSMVGKNSTEKIQVAENGIRARLHEFSMNHGGTPEENHAIEDALNGLNGLRKDVAAWQGSKQAG